MTLQYGFCLIYAFGLAETHCAPWSSVFPRLYFGFAPSGSGMSHLDISDPPMVVSSGRRYACGVKLVHQEEVGMDLGYMLNASFVFALLNIIFINIILSGDNAVVIAMAVRSLPEKQRQKGILLGTAGAVLLRIGLTFIAAKLLEVPLVKLIGGLMIIWIAFKLLVGESEENNMKEVRGLGQAIITILMADLVMSLDNVLGVAGASNGNSLLLFIGLATSIPIVVFTSKLITRLMDRFPVIVLLGAAVLGRVAGEMIMSDPFLVRMLHHPGYLVDYSVQAVLACGVVIVAKAWRRYTVPAGLLAPVPARNPYANPFAVQGWDLL